ncbi:PspA-associated protein PspAB [Streptomyces yaizuensis]|uniref:Uncharacterized protein n=1 Tax=Streptomyces yaizuensis TaxID=2989713 RepID=A0ABQ5P2Y5_9ACTN|nr:hypothetical protein [Streptomyces sp. YSPA8]GLF96909.1 hypothetical protein SYYSPA8_21450 [Streptomyces sp. YSPA8]
MGLLDVILGRSRAARPDLDRLFGVPGAAITLQAGAGFAPAGSGSVCFAGVEGGAFARLRTEVRELLAADGPDGSGTPAGSDGSGPGWPGGAPAGGGVVAEFEQDAYGYTWLPLRRPPDDLVSLVNDVHAVNTLLEEAGFGPQLLCSLFAFREESGERVLSLVYLYKRGTFYPFAPVPGAEERRDNALELSVRALLAEELRMESDLSRWFPVWGAPGLPPPAQRAIP